MLKLSPKNRAALNTYLVIALAFGWTLAVDPSPASANSPDPASQLSSYNADLSSYNSTLASYTSHYNTYDLKSCLKAQVQLVEQVMAAA